MSVSLDPILEKMTGWKDMKDYTNKQMIEIGWNDSIFVRSASPEEEEDLFLENNNNIAVCTNKKGDLEIVISFK